VVGTAENDSTASRRLAKQRPRAQRPIDGGQLCLSLLREGNGELRTRGFACCMGWMAIVLATLALAAASFVVGFRHRN
jgi:hypothetical protein